MDLIPVTESEIQEIKEVAKVDWKGLLKYLELQKEALEKFRAVAESEGMTLSAKIRNVILKTIRKQN